MWIWCRDNCKWGWLWCQVGWMLFYTTVAERAASKIVWTRFSAIFWSRLNYSVYGGGGGRTIGDATLHTHAVWPTYGKHIEPSKVEKSNGAFPLWPREITAPISLTGCYNAINTGLKAVDAGTTGTWLRGLKDTMGACRCGLKPVITTADGKHHLET